MRVLRTDLGEPARGRRLHAAAGRARGRVGREGRRRARAARHLPARRRGARPGRATSAAPRRTGPGPVRGQPGVSVRALLARPPADPVRAGERVTFAVDSRGRPYRWRIFRVGAAEQPRSVASAGARGAASRREGPQAVRRRAHRARAGRPVRRLRAAGEVRRDARPRSRSPSRATRPAPILVVLPGGHVVRPRHARRRPRRAPEHARERQLRRLPAAARRRAARGLRRPGRARCSRSSTARGSTTT